MITNCFSLHAAMTGIIYGVDMHQFRNRLDQLVFKCNLTLDSHKYYVIRNSGHKKAENNIFDNLKLYSG